MNRNGQVWIDLNDDGGVYLVVDGPFSDEIRPYYTVMELVVGELVRWEVRPMWEKDQFLTRLL